MVVSPYHAIIQVFLLTLLMAKVLCFVNTSKAAPLFACCGKGRGLGRVPLDTAFRNIVTKFVGFYLVSARKGAIQKPNELHSGR
jgi:hypothetical protein